MGGERSRRLGNPSFEGWVSDPFFARSSTVEGSDPFQFVPSFIDQGSGSRVGAGCLGRQGGSGTFHGRSGVLLSDVCGKEGVRLLETNYRSFNLEWFCSEDQIQDGDSSVGSCLHSSRRLDVLLGSPRRLSPDPHSSGESSLPSLLHCQRDVSIQSPVFRALHRPTGLHQGYGSGLSHFTSIRDSSTALYRRLVNSSFVKGRMFTGEGDSFRTLYDIRDKNKFSEISSIPISSSDLSWNRHLFTDFDGFTNSETTGYSFINHRRISVLRGSSSVLMEVPSWSPVVLDSIDPQGSTQDEVAPDSAQESLGFSGRFSLDSLEPVLPSRSSMVDSRGSIVSGHLSQDNFPRSDVMVRRVGSGMGRLSSFRSSFRPMVRRRKTLVDQQEGTKGHSDGSPISRVASGSSHRYPMRQFHSSRLPEESGWYSFGVSQPGGSGHSALGRGERDYSDSSVHSRIRECNSGSALSEESSNGLRMDSLSEGLRQPVEGLASERRPVRYCPQLSVSDLFCFFERSPVSWNRCVPSVMGPPECLRFSPILSSSKGFEQGSRIGRSDFNLDCSVLATERVVPGSPGILSGTSHSVANEERSSSSAAFSLLSSAAPVSSSSCLETIRRFARHEGFSDKVARQIGFARRKSTRSLYQHRWDIFRRWCHDRGHSVSKPTLPKIADFLFYLHDKKKLSISSIKGFRSMLSSVFRIKLPEISFSPVLKDLLRSFEIQRPVKSIQAPSWDLIKVLDSLRKPPFEPLISASFRDLTRKVLFLTSLATAKRVSELQALSAKVASNKEGYILTYLPEFVAKTESDSNPLPRFFPLKSLKDFVGNLEEELILCPVRALSIYLKRTLCIKGRPRSLFVSPKMPSRSITKNAISFFIRSLITDSIVLGADEGPVPKAHSVRSVATSFAFQKNWSIARILEAATWRSQSVFTSFYLRDVASSLGDLKSLGAIVAAGQVLAPSE